jgi:hypothetical protein
MTVEHALVYAVLTAALGLFVWGPWRYDIVALGALLALVVPGIVDADRAFLGVGRLARGAVFPRRHRAAVPCPRHASRGRALGPARARCRARPRRSADSTPRSRSTGLRRPAGGGRAPGGDGESARPRRRLGRPRSVPRWPGASLVEQVESWSSNSVASDGRRRQGTFTKPTPSSRSRTRGDHGVRARARSHCPSRRRTEGAGPSARTCSRSSIPRTIPRARCARPRRCRP